MNTDQFGRAVTIAQLIFSYEGRVNRAKYLGGLALTWLVAMFAVIVIVGFAPLVEQVRPPLQNAVAVVAILTVLLLYGVLTWSNTVLLVKRLHDIDMTGWLVLLSFVPIAGLVLMIVALCVDGTWGRNGYGDDVRAVPLSMGGDVAGHRPVTGYRRSLDQGRPA